VAQDPEHELENWTVQVRKGLLELAVLSALSRDEQYGLELLRRLQDVPGLEVQEGTLYPLLSRLRLQGLVRTRLEESPEGPARKYYALTREGRRALAGMRAYVEALVAGLRRLEEKR
jgi:PadR family transcriptional regulator, regulatory protein PadR